MLLSNALEPGCTTKRDLFILPWNANPYHLVTWWEMMEELPAYKFYWLGEMLQKAKKTYQALPVDVPFLAKEKKQVTEWLELLQSLCQDLGLDFTVDLLRRLGAVELRDERLNSFAAREVLDALDEVEHRIQSEMRRASFLFVKPGHVEFYEQKEPLFGQQVRDAFPSAIVDIEEAGKCFALNRYTACVFHLQRVMEHALILLAAALDVPYQNNPSWDSILQKVDKELKFRYPEQDETFKAGKEFFVESAAMLRVVKDAWRNPTMHVEKVYDEEKAKDILTAVKAFLRQLSAHLHE